MVRQTAIGWSRWLAVLAGWVLSAGPTVGHGAARETFYRCHGANGQSYVGQSIPDECMGADVQVLDATGRVVRTITGQRSVEQVSDQKAAMDAHNAAAQRDRTLLFTYLSVADIERLRDQRIGQLEQQALITRQYIGNLKAREKRVMQDVQRYRPYSSKPDAPPLPDTLADEMVNTVNGLQVYQQELVKNAAEQKRLQGEFAADIARFKELKGEH